MWQDPVVSEIHQTRDRISQAYGDDLHAIFAAAQRGELSNPPNSMLKHAATSPRYALHEVCITAAAALTKAP